jgi:hypothetical protein
MEPIYLNLVVVDNITPGYSIETCIYSDAWIEIAALYEEVRHLIVARHFDSIFTEDTADGV